jgi:tetratricopeptide (TPR) repeat protein
VDALKYHELDLSIKKRIYPLNHQLLGDSYLNIGFVYHDNNEYEESLIFFNKALSIYQETLGENSDATALAYNNIFSALNNLNNYKEAYRNLQKALKIWRKIFPNTHPYIINAEKDLNKLQEKLSLNKSKISRNAPCICGSGIKYKKCCGM